MKEAMIKAAIEAMVRENERVDSEEAEWLRQTEERATSNYNILVADGEHVGPSTLDLMIESERRNPPVFDPIYGWIEEYIIQHYYEEQA